MTIDKINSYVLRKIAAEKKLTELSTKYEAFVNLSFSNLINRQSFSLQEMDEMKDLGWRVNKLTTEVQWIESQLDSSEYFLEERYKLN